MLSVTEQGHRRSGQLLCASPFQELLGILCAKFVMKWHCSLKEGRAWNLILAGFQGSKCGGGRIGQKGVRALRSRQKNRSGARGAKLHHHGAIDGKSGGFDKMIKLAKSS